MMSSQQLPPYNRPILVAGAHRTGTTWVGKMLAANPQVAYISEPLNVWHRPGVMRAPVQYWYTYIHARNQAAYLAPFQETLCFQYHPWLELRSLRSTRDALRMGRDFSTFLVGKIRKQRPLLKDPFAIFSAPWFAQALNCQVVITVRHPAAFASSLKRLNWAFDFNDLLAQPLLMQDWLEPFRSEMQALAKRPDAKGDIIARGGIIAQASLLWRMVYEVVAKYRDQNPEFQIVRHEDLSIDPVPGYQALYHSLGLDFTPTVEQTILNSSSADNPGELSKKSVHAVRLDSRANLHNWKRRLQPEEIQRIREITADIAGLYYPEIEWD